MRPVHRALGLLGLVLLAGCAGATDAEGDDSAAALGGVGVLDPRFGQQGVVRGTQVGKEATTALAYDDQDRLLLASASWDTDVLRVERRLRDGKIDPAFTQRTAIPLLLPPGEGAALALQPMSDGSTLVLASSLCALSTCPHDYDEAGKVTRVLLKLRPDGDLDRTFAGGAGAITFDSPQRGSLATYRAHVTRSGSEAVVAIDAPKGKTEVRWISAAGATVKSHTLTGQEGETRALAATRTSAVVGRAGGDGRESFGSVVGVDRASGALNPGIGRWSAEFTAGPLLTRLVATRDHVWVLGYAAQTLEGTPKVAIKKLEHDLLFDPTFGRFGTKELDAGTDDGGALTDLRELPDGRVLVVGSIDVDDKDLKPGKNHDLAYLVLRANGSYDASFSERGLALVEAGGNDDRLSLVSSASKDVFAAGFSGRTNVITKLFTR